MRSMTIMVTIAMLVLCYYNITACQLRFKTNKKEACEQQARIVVAV